MAGGKGDGSPRHCHMGCERPGRGKDCVGVSKGHHSLGTEALSQSCLQPWALLCQEFPCGLTRSPPAAHVTVLGGDGDGNSWSVGFLIPCKSQEFLVIDSGERLCPQLRL